MKCCYAACGRVLYELSKALVCALCVLNTPLRQKVASSLSITEMENCGSAALGGRNHCAHATGPRWSSDCRNGALWRWKSCKASTCRTRWTADRDVPMVAATTLTLSGISVIEYNRHFFSIWVFELFAATRYPASFLWRIRVLQGSAVPDRTFDD